MTDDEMSEQFVRAVHAMSKILTSGTGELLVISITRRDGIELEVLTQDFRVEQVAKRVMATLKVMEEARSRSR